MTNRGQTKKIWIDRSLLIYLVVGAFALGVFAGSGISIFTSYSADKDEVIKESTEGTFRFIRSFAESNALGKNHPTRELKPFQYKVNSLVENALKNGDANAISVYFRDLNNGNWFGIREHDKFSPKILLKVPLMIAYFKWAESSPLVLRKTLYFSGKVIGVEQNRDVHLNGLDPRKSYTVNDLIFRMIVDDDTAAYSLLYVNLPSGRLDKVFKDLYVEYDPRKQEDFLSLNAFAAFYRVLYNSSYLSEEMSEKALRYLSKSSLRSNMASAVPPNIEIACKQGERTISASNEGEQQEIQQLHEFGIIYHPNRPFLLGVMTQGNNVERLAKVIRDITRLVYDEVDSQS
jgi:beta-lactamase class A